MLFSWTWIAQHPLSGQFGSVFPSLRLPPWLLAYSMTRANGSMKEMMKMKKAMTMTNLVMNLMISKKAPMRQQMMILAILTKVLVNQ